MPWLASLVDESDKGVESREEMKEAQELGVVKSWMWVGGLLTLVEEVQILLWEVYPFFLSTWFGSVCQSILSLLSFELDLCDGSHSFLFFSGFGSTKEGQCAEGEGTATGDGGVGRIEMAVAGLGVEGLYRLLRGAILHSLMSSAPPYPKNAPTTQPPPSPSHSSGVRGSCTQSFHRETELAPEVPSLAASPVLGMAIPAHMTPLCLQLGGIKRVYKCQVEGCSEGPSTSQATICVHVCRDHLGVGLACPSCAKTFFNLDVLRHHRKIHDND